MSNFNGLFEKVALVIPNAIYTLENLWEIQDDFGKFTIGKSADGNSECRIDIANNQLAIASNGQLVYAKVKKDRQALATGHPNWNVAMMVAKDDFVGVAIVGGKIMSKLDYDQKIALGENVMVDKTINDGIIKIVKGKQEIQAFAV